MAGIKLVDVQGMKTILEIDKEDSNYRGFLEEREKWRRLKYQRDDRWFERERRYQCWNAEEKAAGACKDKFLDFLTHYLSKIQLTLKNGEYTAVAGIAKTYDKEGKEFFLTFKRLDFGCHIPLRLELYFAVLETKKSQRLAIRSILGGIDTSDNSVAFRILQLLYSPEGNGIGKPKILRDEFGGLEIASVEQVQEVCSIIREIYKQPDFKELLNLSEGIGRAQGDMDKIVYGILNQEYERRLNRYLSRLQSKNEIRGA